MRLTRRRALFGLAAALAAPGIARAESLSLSASLRPPPRPPALPGRLIASADLGARISYAVLDAQTGALLEGRDAQRPAAPASTLKTVTALYALDRLGPERRFATRLLLAGDRLVLAGGGDPLLDTDHLADLADAAAAAGLDAPAQFEVWGGALPAMHEIAPGQAPHLAYNPAISGMILNFNRVHFDWRRGNDGYRLGFEARARRESPVAYTVRAETVGSGPVFGWRREGAREVWSVNRASLGAAGSRWMPVRLPELYAGDVFQTLCRARGLALPTPQIAASLPDGAREIARIESPPLREILAGMMNFSTNLTAEVAGLHASGARDLAASAADMQRWAHERGFDAMRFADHSGMSPSSRVSARDMALLAVRARPEDQIEGLMRDISPFDENAPLFADGLRITAKSGTLNFVSNLAGFAEAPGRRKISFAIFVANEDRRAGTEGQEMPAGVAAWTGRARSLHQQLIAAWVQRYGAS